MATVVEEFGQGGSNLLNLSGCWVGCTLFVAWLAATGHVARQNIAVGPPGAWPLRVDAGNTIRQTISPEVIFRLRIGPVHLNG